MIKTILFDLDGTLLDRDGSLVVYIHQQRQRCKELLSHIPLPDYLSKIIELDAHGHSAKDILFQQLADYFNLPKQSWKILLNDFRTYFPDTCVPFPKMHQTLQELQKRGISLGLVTNGTSASQNPKIDGLGIRDYFGVILVSETEGIRKPDPKIFQRALDVLKASPATTAFVGDHPEADIHAAKNVGMKTIWIKNACWLAPTDADDVISQVYELPEVI